MAKKAKKAKHTVSAGFPGMGAPMDITNHPANNLPAPQGGAFDGAQLMAPGAPIVPGEAM